MPRNHILTSEFWREYRIDAARSGHDLLARKRFLLRTFFLAYTAIVLAGAAWLVYRLHDSATYIILAILIAPFVIIPSLRAFADRRDEKRQTALDRAATHPAINERMTRLAQAQAATVHRALSELWLKSNKLPADSEVRTRRVLLDALRSSGAWDEMPATARAWMLRPDGGWPEQQSAITLADAETLHTLAWILFVEDNLRPLDRLAEAIPFDRLSERLSAPAAGIRPPWDLRVARNLALAYFVRCHAEMVHRGFTSADEQDPQQKALAEEWVAEIAEGAIPDSLSGSETIAEIDDDILRAVARLAACRVQTLTIVLDILDADNSLDEPRWIALTALAFTSFTEPAAESL